VVLGSVRECSRLVLEASVQPALRHADKEASLRSAFEISASVESAVARPHHVVLLEKFGTLIIIGAKFASQSAANHLNSSHEPVLRVLMQIAGPADHSVARNLANIHLHHRAHANVAGAIASLLNRLRQFRAWT
jgi:hypothetical protein